jgi:hypothetical protein
VGPRARGESPRGGGSTEALVQAGARAKRCASRDLTPSKAWHAHSILSGAARRQVGVVGRPCRSRASLQETRHDGRRLGSFLHSLSVGEDSTPHGGGRWDDPGHAGESDSERSRGRAGRQLPVGLEPSRWCPRATRTSEDGTISVKAPPAVATDDQARGVSIQDAERCRRVACSDTVPADLREGWRIGCIGIGSAEAGVSE